MRFGHMPLNTMNNKLVIFFAAIVLLAFGCHHNNEQVNISISPEAGSAYKAGDVVNVKVGLPSDAKVDSIVYLIDSTRFVSRKDSAALSLKTDSMPLGIKLITARVYQGATKQEVSTNILLLAAKAPEKYTFKVVKVFPHDTSSYTEGLLYQDGFLYESSGGTVTEGIGQSSLRKVELNTGKVVQKAMLDPKIFGEGISIVGNKIYMMTWTTKIGYVYDKDSFKLLNTYTDSVGIEGWGLCFDGNKLYKDDSSNRVWFIDKNKWKATGHIDVCDNTRQIDSLNELEYIGGKLYANVYTQNYILIIDPKTGTVLGTIDLSPLVAENHKNANADVLNGIAYDAKTNRIFITGKKWPHLYQVEFVKE